MSSGPEQQQSWEAQPAWHPNNSAKPCCPLTDLVGPLILLLLPIRLIQLVLQLSLQVFLGVHDVQIFIIVMIPLIFILAAAADIIKYLPEFIMF